MDFDSPPSGKDIDSQAFREFSLPQVGTVLRQKLIDLRGVVKSKDNNSLQRFITDSADDINRAVVGANTQDNISSTPDTAIMHALGLVLWRKPIETAKLESGNLTALIAGRENGTLDGDRFAKGVYFLEVLLHKYKDGNGRVARALKALIDKSGDTSELSEDDIKHILGIGRKGITQTGENKFQINFNPDFERLVLGVAYFGLHKGLSPEVVTKELKLNGVMPEQGLELLAQKIGVQKNKLKEEFIRFMVVDSDLDWCNF